MSFGKEFSLTGFICIRKVGEFCEVSFSSAETVQATYTVGVYDMAEGGETCISVMQGQHSTSDLASGS